MAINVHTEIQINRRSDDVASFASNPDNAPRWYTNITAVEWQTDRPLRLGTELKFVARFMGRDMSYTYVVAEYTPGHRLVMRTAEGPFPMETTYEFESVTPARSRMTLVNRGGPSGFLGFLAPLLAIVIRRENRKDLARLKSLLEAANEE